MNKRNSIPNIAGKIAHQLLLAFLLAAPMSASANYIDFGISQQSDMFCGLFEDGSTECRTTYVRDLADISSDPNTVFTDIEVGGLYACGITSGGSLECWGTAAESVLNPPSFDSEVVAIRAYNYGACAIDSASNVKCWGELNITPDFYDRIFPAYVSEYGLNCELDSSGNALCEDSAANRLVTFSNGPYKHVSVSGFGGDKFACAVTYFGEVDCTNGTLANPESPTLLSVTREPNTYSLTRPSTANFCGFTTENRFECFSRSSYVRPNRQVLLDMVNGELELQTIELQNAEVYDFGVELFFEKSFASHHTINTLSNMDIYRDGVFLMTTVNGESQIDRTAEPNTEYVYSARMTHPYGQIGELSNDLYVNTTPSFSGDPTSPEVSRSNGTTGLRADIYWYDIELFWTRNETGAVKNYEIRKNGQFIASTRGTSWYDNTTESGPLYVYDVIAIGHDDSILGFESVHVQIGESECN